jgi:hypothetical protein
LRVTVVGSLEALPEAAAERAIVDGSADLEQSFGATPDVAVHALNRMLELGRPESVRIA